MFSFSCTASQTLFIVEVLRATRWCRLLSPGYISAPVAISGSVGLFATGAKIESYRILFKHLVCMENMAFVARDKESFRHRIRQRYTPEVMPLGLLGDSRVFTTNCVDYPVTVYFSAQARAPSALTAFRDAKRRAVRERERRCIRR